jgi:Ser-tRNA(Ala) deacylase AlaX
MKIMLKEVIEGQGALQKLSGMVLKGRTAFQVARLLKKLEEVLTSYNDTRLKLIEKYAKRKEDGEFELNEKNEYQFTQENMQAYMDEINKLIMEEVEIEAKPIPVEDIENLEFTPAEASFLEPFLQFE